MKVLIVDDDADIGYEIGSFLKRRGYHAVVATGAKSGAALLVAEQFAAVLTDMRMADGTGLDVLGAANDGRVPVKLVMTGQASADDLAQAHTLGAQKIFAKPLSLRALLGELGPPAAAVPAGEP